MIKRQREIKRVPWLANPFFFNLQQRPWLKELLLFQESLLFVSDQLV